MEYLFMPNISDREFKDRIIEIDKLIASGINPKDAFKMQGFIKKSGTDDKNDYIKRKS